jgi:hypothetical protein
VSELNDDPYDTARKNGLDIVLPDPDQLFLDIDDADGEAQLAGMLDVLTDLLDVGVEKRTTSAGGNHHVYLRVGLPFAAALDPVTRIALQACLGSDRKRELLSLLRILHRLDRPPTVFFETPAQPAVEASIAEEIEF